MSYILVTSYTHTVGACRGGNNPENDAGHKYWPGVDWECEYRCNRDHSCTGYLLDKTGNGCVTYTSVGATGDGRPGYICYMKLLNEHERRMLLEGIY